MPEAPWIAWLRRAALGASGVFVVGMLALFALRVGHPYLLEWQEGAMVDQTARILGGEPLYAAPTIDFIAQIYAPLYFYLSAGVAALLGVGFVPLRIVSIAATLGCLACMAFFTWRETRSTQAVALTLGLFAATYPVSAAFLDVGRVDALFLFFCMAGVTLVRGAKGPGATAAAAVLFALAFATKQQGALFCVAMTIWVAVDRGWRPALLLGGTFGVAAAIFTLGLSAATGGWSDFYLFALPGSHELFWPMLWTFWVVDLLQPLPIACLLAAGWLVELARRRAISDLVFWTMFLGVCTGSALGSRMHWGGAANVVLPAYMGVALCFGVSTERLRAGPSRAPAWAGALAALSLMQLLWLVYDPRPFVPREVDRQAGDAFVEAMSELDGDVLATWHGYLPRLAGKRVFAHRSAIYDVMRSDQTEVKEALQAAFDDALAAHRFGAVVVDQPFFLRDYEKAALEQHYRHVGPMLEDGLVIGGLLGYRANPHLYVPRSASESGAVSEGDDSARLR